MKPNNKVIYNSGILYTKMLITVVITLYSTRIALKALGASDYGIFYLVAGIIAMLSFINTAMTISTQRYLSFYMGKELHANLRHVFANSLLLHLLIGIIVLILLEITGLFLLQIINIPPESEISSIWIFQFMVISSFFTIVFVPYDAVINSNENMTFVALIGIIESIAKLAIAYYISTIQDNRLIVFGGLLAALTIIIIFIKRLYGKLKYDECRVSLSFKRDKKLFYEMFSFASWNLYGTLCGLSRSQGMALILNFFFGSVINASYGIANQINGQVSYLSASLSLAFNPQIMKSEGSGDRIRMLKLSSITSKYAYYLVSLLAIPLIIEMEYILEIWLVNVPPHSLQFCQLILVLTIISQLTIGLQSSVQAVGRIKLYQFTIGTINLLSPILAFILFKYSTFQPQFVFILIIIIEIVASFWRLLFLKSLAGLSIKNYFIQVILPCSGISIISYLVTFLMHNVIFYPDFIRLLISLTISFLVSICLIVLVGMSSAEKDYFISFLKKLKNKFIAAI